MALFRIQLIIIILQVICRMCIVRMQIWAIKVVNWVIDSLRQIPTSVMNSLLPRRLLEWVKRARFLYFWRLPDYDVIHWWDLWQLLRRVQVLSFLVSRWTRRQSVILRLVSMKSLFKVCIIMGFHQRSRPHITPMHVYNFSLINADVVRMFKMADFRLVASVGFLIVIFI